MRPRVKKVRRQHEAGAIVVEQTRDVVRVVAMLQGAGRSTAGLEYPGVCTMIAHSGGRPAGVVAIEAVIDAAVMRSLLVAEASRGLGVGADLVAAARTAAHTRGARKLYAFVSAAEGSYLQRSGFVPAPVDEALAALSGTFVADFLEANPDKLARRGAWLLDISMDGIVVR